MNNRFGLTAPFCFTAEMVDQNENMLKCENMTKNIKNNCSYNGAGGTAYIFFKN